MVVKHKSANLFKKYLDYMSFYLSSTSTLINSNYDVVYLNYFTHTFPPIILGKVIHSIINRRKLKIIAHVHGNDLEPEKVINRLVLNILKPFRKSINGWIVPSNYYSSVLRDYLINKEVPILVYPSGGVDTKLFKPMNKKEVREKFYLDMNDFVIGWVSRIDKRKGWEVFLKALYRANFSIPNIKAIVAGGGNDELQFKKVVRNLGIEDKIIMLGNVKHEQLPFVYNTMDVFVFPTMKESLGLVGLEALSCGIPVIASNIDGPKEYIEENMNGFLFEPGSAESLYRKIMLFYNLPDKKKEEIKRRARETALKYDSHKVNQDLVKFLLEVYYEDNRNS